jgi:hypothetical protein
MSTAAGIPTHLAERFSGVLSFVGYDPAIVLRLKQSDARFFVGGSAIALLATGLVSTSAGYGTALTLGVAAAPLVALAVAFFFLNLLRLHHAGSGYPLHKPIEDIDRWRPAGAAVVVLFVLGLFLTHPLVLWVLRPIIDDVLAARAAEAAAVRAGLGVDAAPVVVGLIARTRAAWDEALLPTVGLSLLFATVVCAPALLRRTGARAVRLYESERWVNERMLVDDAWAENLDGVTAILTATAPGFVPPLAIHYADPPYNTRPLVFGLDPALFVTGRLRLKRGGKTDASPVWPPPSTSTAPPPPPPPTPPTPPTQATPTATSPTLERLPSAPTTPQATPTTGPRAEGPPERLPSAPTTPTTTTTTTTTTATSTTTARSPSSWAGKSVVPVSRMTAAEVRGSDDDGLLLFVALYLEKPRDEVVSALNAAAPDAPLHKVFPEWNKLPTLLLKSAGFALDAGLASLIAIAVDKPRDQVERRLRAAPRDKKVSGVFAPELARIVLRQGG